MEEALRSAKQMGDYWAELLDYCGKYIRKEDTNNIVMNFLVRECNEEVAQAFREESGTEPDRDREKLQPSANIRNKILQGDSYGAYTDLCSSYTLPEYRLYYELQLQVIVEYIRDGKLEEAIKFGQYLLSKYNEKSFAGEKFQEVFGLLAFDDPFNCPLQELLSPIARRKVADATRRSLLVWEDHEQDSKLDYLLKELLFAQDEIAARGFIHYPKLDLSTGRIETPVIPNIASPPLEE